MIKKRFYQVFFVPIVRIFISKKKKLLQNIFKKKLLKKIKLLFLEKAHFNYKGVLLFCFWFFIHYLFLENGKKWKILISIQFFNYCNFFEDIIITLETWGKEVPLIYFHNINHCWEACLRRWTNNLPDFYFVCDKIEQQCELLLPGSVRNEEIFMEFLFAIRRVAENILKKTEKK